MEIIKDEIISKIKLAGFKEIENEYVKNSWTIRFDNDMIEAFNDPDLTPGIYHTAPINKIDIEGLLSDIEDNING